MPLVKYQPMKRVVPLLCLLLFPAFMHGTSVYAPYVQYFQSSGTFPTSYFGNTVQAYKYGTPPGAPWPGDAGVPITLVRNLGVFSPGDGSIHFVGWGDINTSDGVYDWTYMDLWVATMATKGVDMIFTMFSAPSWTGGSGTNPTPTQVTNFYSALATRYAGQIKYYEGWNEFNGSFGGTDNELVAIQQAMYQAVKAADPTATVLSYTITGIFFGSMTFWNNVTNAGGKNWFDVVAFHSYGDDTGESVVVTAGKVRQAMVDTGVSSKPLIDTEGSWQPDGLTDATKQLAVAMKQLILEYWMGVSRKVWYAVDGADVGHLMDPQFSLTVTQAGTGFVTASSWLTGAAIADSFKILGSLWYGDLTRAGGYQARVIWTTEASRSYTAPGTYTQYKDYTGANHVISGAITLTSIPILLENHDP